MSRRCVVVAREGNSFEVVELIGVRKRAGSRIIIGRSNDVLEPVEVSGALASREVVAVADCSGTLLQ